MISAGIDIGSRTVKLALVSDGQLIESKTQSNSHDPVEVCRELLHGVNYDCLTATGYGRHLFSAYWSCRVLTEISAAAAGARYFCHQAEAVLDIGGQDMKAVSLDKNGGAAKFEMNDKCAAGSGKFLEVMAAALSYSMADFVNAACAASNAEKINSMCTVFAESEVVSLVARGASRENLALGIHQSIAARAASMLQRVASNIETVFFCGGAAYNNCLLKLIAAELRPQVYVPKQPQIVSALGAALLGV